MSFRPPRDHPMLPIFQALRVDAARAILRIPEYPASLQSGRGIVICAGGPTYFVQAWVTIRLLRKLGCKLPIQVWHRDAGEITPTMRGLLESYRVECVNAQHVAREIGATRLPGWAIKPFAIMHSRFQEVLFLDSDSVPVRDPEYLFSDPSFRATGSLFWTDRFRGLSSAYSTVHPKAWSAMNVAHRDEPECESGQLMVNKSVVWRELSLCLYFNEHADSYYQFLYGDKDTFRFAWHRLGRTFNTVPFGPSSPPNFRVLYQLDPSGNVIFQHRARAKWNVRGGNRPIPGFQHEASCREFLGEMDLVWDRILREWQRGGSEEMRALRQSLSSESEHFCFLGQRFVGTATFVADGHLSSGVKYLPTHWQIVQQPDDTLCLALMGDRAAPILLEARDGGWLGQRVAGQRESIFLIPRREAVRYLKGKRKYSQQTQQSDISASRSAAQAIVSYECELLESGQPPANELILRLEGGSLASGEEPTLSQLDFASERPASPSWSGESRPGSASAIQLEMFADADVAWATQQAGVPASSQQPTESAWEPSEGIDITKLSTVFEESAWPFAEHDSLSGQAMPPYGEPPLGAAESLSSYGESLWPDSEFLWSGSESIWSGGSEVAWSGGEFAWSGGEFAWSGGEFVWSGGEFVWLRGEFFWSGGEAAPPFPEQHWTVAKPFAASADILRLYQEPTGPSAEAMSSHGDISPPFLGAHWSHGAPPKGAESAWSGAAPLGFAESVWSGAAPLGFAESAWSGAAPLGFAESVWSGAAPLGFSESAWSGPASLGFSESAWSGAAPLGFTESNWSGGESLSMADSYAPCAEAYPGVDPFEHPSRVRSAGIATTAARPDRGEDQELASGGRQTEQPESMLPFGASGPAKGSCVKIYGMPRTCTNLVAHLIRRNFHARVFANQLGWKHGPNLWREGDQIDGCPLKFVICVRHPYAWLASFYRFETEGHGLTCSFPEFVRGTCMTYPSRNPIDRYNLLVRMWLGLAVSPECAQVVRAETIQTDQLATLETLERQLSFRRRHRQLRGEQRRVGPDEQIRRRAFDPSYYKGQRFLSHYDADLLAFVNDRIDRDLMESLQYRLLDEMPSPSGRALS